MKTKMLERVRIHQVIPAHPGTRAVYKITEADGREGRTIEPVVLFALVEDAVDGGDRYVIPMEPTGNGAFEANPYSTCLIEVLAPGQEPEPWMMGVEVKS
jgi:hypothetical protein